ncbi:hypothetical protein [Belliella aquatica]|uniref:Uncharacterized protein n=1 Tax=Belliella aquatica TaxID=1323734 RepID=A0ABQ1MRD0_9BACT|nr:hypothetical protein [Belliella aquatica]GGC43414.1 hypothetical protein GCM10010993_22420 [Belliella aquatica]
MINLKQLELLEVYHSESAQKDVRANAPFRFDIPDVFYEDDRAKAPVCDMMKSLDSDKKII